MTSYPTAGGSDKHAATATAQPSQPLAHGCGPMPNTPDVINSIMSMMGPFEHFSGGGCGVSTASDDSSGSTCSPVSPPRMQSICSSLLIKEELKLAIQSKQRIAAAGNTTLVAARGGISSGGLAAVAATASSAGSAASSPGGGGQAKKRRAADEESHDDDDDDDNDEDGDGDDVSSHGEGLTAEDEERRKRRRERNKIAATKCRLKKREKTTNLMQESSVLETKNYDLKTQIQELESQRNELMKMLTAHPCTRRMPNQHRQHHQHLQHHHQQQPSHHQHQQQQPSHQLHQQQQQQQQHREQYVAELYTNDPYRQHHHVAAEPPILKDAMFNGGYVPAAVAPVAVQADRPTSAYHQRPATTTAASVATFHYPVAGAHVGGGGGVMGGGGVYASCVDDLYGFNKDLIGGGGGGPPDLSHQYYDQGIC
ncbi:activating transcription factor 3-like [Sipha flava]|uniref:Activating transcription factor 3-like n=3 Tax=Sipha flava TaxID=143950 RepID=A0A8B8G647_9HEMI|nr:activating transcription factor 3-like [Sipha flava]XP_025418705.1 activating transcription factor 3-like [Sipha flava]XP_025418706.1 activating transcription factor 3-like [Sipha flava]